MILAARTAKAQLQSEGKMEADKVKKTTDDAGERQRARRERIDAQAPPRSRTSDDDDDSTPTMTAAQKHMAKSLGVSEEKFLAQKKAGAHGR